MTTPAFAKEMEAELQNPPEIFPVAPPPKYAIDCPEKAAWLVGKMNALADREALIKSQAEAMLKDVENDRRFLEWRFGEALREWARDNLPEGKKSIKLLTGTVAFRTNPARLEVVDEKACLAWAVSNCEAAYRVKEEVDKRALAEYFKKSGELPPGCEVKPETESFSVKGAKS